MQPKTKVIIEALTALSAADDTETAVITEENLTPSREHFSKMAGKLQGMNLQLDETAAQELIQGGMCELKYTVLTYILCICL